MIKSTRKVRPLKHGQSIKGKRTPEYRAWYGTIERCLRKKHKSYKNYGERGIKVCDRWLDSFENFYEDMGQKPSPRHSLERKDVNGDYEPNNCCWGTPVEQARNKRLFKTNTSGHKGVGWHTQKSRWYSRIYVDKKVMELGYFKNIKDAVEARKNAEIKHYSESS